jgi:hypothetical protein
MSTQSERLPPVPQLVAPLRNYEIAKAGGDIKPEMLRFDTPWLQWFIQLKIKVDTINGSLISIGSLAGANPGFGVIDSNGLWVTRTITGTAGEIDVADGDGESADPVIKIAASYTTAINNALADRVRGNVRLTVGTTPPASPAIGDLWVDTN